MGSLLVKFEKLTERFVPRFLLTIIVMLVLISGYLLLNNNLEHKVDLFLPLDGMIPYLPWTVVIYATLYVLYMAVTVVLDSKAYTQVLADLILMTLISFVFFTIITSHYPRPPASAWADSIWKPLIDLMVSIDAPGNTCPSLHVSTSIYLALVLRQRPYGALWVFWGILVSLSTLTLKQHFVWDWIGGVILALAVIKLNPWTSAKIDRLRQTGLTN